MSRIFIICIFFSLIWHSFAFTLFKLTEPYTRSPEQPEYIAVSLMPSSKNIQKRIMAFDAHHDAMSDYRFSLPYKSANILPAAPIPYTISKPLEVSEIQPDFSSTLIEHLPVIPLAKNEGNALSEPNALDTLKPLPAIPVQRHFFEVSKPAQPETQQFAITELDDSRQPIVKMFPDNANHARSVYLRFSIDRSGKVRFVFVEKSSGNAVIDQLYIAAFKQWAFNAKKIPLSDGDVSGVEWGRIIFF